LKKRILEKLASLDYSTAVEPKSNYLQWYHLLSDMMGALVEKLSDIEVMEYLSEDIGLTVPIVGVGDEQKPMPILEVSLQGEEVTLSITYRTSKSMEHLKNIFHESQRTELERLIQMMKQLPVTYETRLSKKGFRGEGSFTLSRKYLSCRVDDIVLQHILGEAEALRMGGRRTIDGRSVYDAPATPLIQLVLGKVTRNEEEVKTTLNLIKPLIEIITAVKTQREIIHTRLTRPVDQTKQYREFVDLLNRARNAGHISSVERRMLEKKGRDNLEDRQQINEELRKKLGTETV
jgi:hypothetical protein